MARNIKVLNLSRKSVRIGSKNIAPAVANPTPTTLDLEDGQVRRGLARYGDNIVIVGGFTAGTTAAAIADVNTGTVTTAQLGTAVNSILAALRSNGVVASA